MSSEYKEIMAILSSQLLLVQIYQARIEPDLQILDLLVVKVEFLYSNLSKIHLYELQKYPQKKLFLKCYSAVYRGRCVG